jgi:hypothetical protein
VCCVVAAPGQIVCLAFSEIGGKKEQQLLVGTKYGVEVRGAGRIEFSTGCGETRDVQHSSTQLLLLQPHALRSHTSVAAGIRL